MTIELEKAGLSTTVQDLGREGYYHVGIPPSGALDQYSLRAANLLVGNAEGDGALECTYMGPQVRFARPAVVAVAGAEMEPGVDGVAQPMWSSFEVPAGALLTFGHMTRGARAYIAVRGGIDVPEKLGSRSTYLLGALGGFHGRALADGDVLAVGEPRTPATPRTLAADLRPSIGGDVSVRVVLGLYDHLLSDAGRSAFLKMDWTLTPVADRVGFRYKGDRAIEMRSRKQPFGAGSDPSNIVDAPYPIGSIQVPGGIEPIVLHRDAVSGGGYAMIATVISADMDLIAQGSPGDRTRFVPVDLDTALAARRAARDRRGRMVQGLA